MYVPSLLVKAIPYLQFKGSSQRVNHKITLCGFVGWLYCRGLTID
jgi:hypothetical protein